MPAELRTARLHLRPWRRSDAEAHRILWGERDPRSARLIDADGRPTVEDLRRWVDERAARRSVTGIGLYAIDRVADSLVVDEMVGYCGLLEGDRGPAEPELAYELARRFHGQGYATEAARAVVDAAAATGRTRLWAGVRAWNAASFRVLDKVGFVASGAVVPDEVHGDSVWMTRRLA